MLGGISEYIYAAFLIVVLGLVLWLKIDVARLHAAQARNLTLSVSLDNAQRALDAQSRKITELSRRAAAAQAAAAAAPKVVEKAYERVVVKRVPVGSDCRSAVGVARSDAPVLVKLRQSTSDRIQAGGGAGVSAMPRNSVSASGAAAVGNNASQPRR